MIFVNTMKAKAILECLSKILWVIEFEKHNLSMDSYRTIRKNLNSIAKELFGMDGVTKLEASAMKKLRGGD